MGEEGETGIEIKTAMILHCTVGSLLGLSFCQFLSATMNCTSKVLTIIIIVAHLLELFCWVVQYRQATSLGKYENISTISSAHVVFHIDA